MFNFRPGLMGRGPQMPGSRFGSISAMKPGGFMRGPIPQPRGMMLDNPMPQMLGGPSPDFFNKMPSGNGGSMQPYNPEQRNRPFVGGGNFF